jgi:hypothetical protein
MTAGACTESLQRARSGVEAGRAEAACLEREAGSAAHPAGGTLACPRRLRLTAAAETHSRHQSSNPFCLTALRGKRERTHWLSGHGAPKTRWGRWTGV